MIGAALGAYAEGGPNAAKLLEIAAPAMARKTWASAVGPSPEEYTRTIRQHLYSCWGIAAARARAIAHRSYFNMAYDPRADDNRRTVYSYRAEREKLPLRRLCERPQHAERERPVHVTLIWPHAWLSSYLS